MKMIKDKEILMAAEVAGFPLKEAVKDYLIHKGWHVTDVGMQTADEENPEMFQRVGFKVGSMIAEGAFERALIFCGTGMGIHLAASKCPHVHCAVVESIQAAKRAITGNNCNILSMGSFYIAPLLGMQIAEAYLSSNFGDGYEDWENFNEFHKLAYDEIDQFDYEAYKANGFKPIKLGEVDLKHDPYHL